MILDVPMIHRVVRGVVGSHPLAEDAVQEALIGVWEATTADPGLSDTYARVIARSKAHNVLRGRQHFGAPRRTPGSGHQATETGLDALVALELEPTWEPIDEAQDARLVDELLAVLEPEEERIARLMMDGYRHAEIGALMGRSVGWVRDRTPRIRSKLTPHLRSAS